MSFLEGKKILVTGATGFVGSHLCNALNNDDLIGVGSDKYDLRIKYDVWHMFEDIKPDVVFNLAANVGGIGYNMKHPYSLFLDNLLINSNVIDIAIEFNVEKFIQLGTVCCYPKFAKTPFSEVELWDGYPEETNAPYGIAKRAALAQLQAARQEFGFNGIYLLPTNLYGPNDVFNPNRSHVIAALIKRCYEAKNDLSYKIDVWGTGNASRDFLYIEDAIKAIILCAEKYNNSKPLNIGSGEEVRISALVHYITKAVGFEGKTYWDISKPDGQPRRKLDIKNIKSLGWTPKTHIKKGIEKTVEWYTRKELELA